MKKGSNSVRVTQQRPHTTHPSKFSSGYKLKKPLMSGKRSRLRSRHLSNRIFDNSKENTRTQFSSQRLNINKKLRNAEADRKAYAEETVAVIKKQRTKLEFLQRENSALKETLTQGLDKKLLLMNGTNMKKESKRMQETEEEECRRFEKLIAEEEKKLSKIQSNIKIFEKQIGEPGILFIGLLVTIDFYLN